MLQLRTWMVISFLAIISLMSICLFAYYYWQHSRRYYFTNQIKEIIKQGEGAHLEFKSTLRYDLKKKKINKLLEKVVLKSIAAFNNSDGGLLLIGVDDAGKILGLKADYRTLKKPDKDGFELHLRSLIYTSLMYLLKASNCSFLNSSALISKKFSASTSKSIIRP